MMSAGGKAEVVLVTGASGFIGSHLVDRLVAEGKNVRCLVRSAGASTPASSLPDARTGDLLDVENLRRVLDGVSVVYHLAGVATAGHLTGAVDQTVLVNVVGTLNLLEAARQAKVERVVLVSSSHVYGPVAPVPVAEDASPDPRSTYAATKLAAEKLALNYHVAFGLPVTILRLFNVYGPRQSKAAVIPTIIVQALARQPLALQALRPRRDFVFVEDVVDGLLRAAITPQSVGHIVNLGSGTDTSVADLARYVLRLAGSPLPSPLPPVFDDDSDRSVADTRLAQELLGWEAGTTLEEGLLRTIDWWRWTAI